MSKPKKFPFHTVIENGYCAKVYIDENNNVVIIVPFGIRKHAESFTKKLRGRHKYE